MLRQVTISTAVLLLGSGFASGDYTMRQFSVAVFRVMDTNADWVISRPEHTAYFETWQAPPPFDSFDGNRNGALDGVEVDHLIDEVGNSAVECDVNIDHVFTGAELQCLNAYLQ